MRGKRQGRVHGDYGIWGQTWPARRLLPQQSPLPVSVWKAPRPPLSTLTASWQWALSRVLSQGVNTRQSSVRAPSGDQMLFRCCDSQPQARGLCLVPFVLPTASCGRRRVTMPGETPSSSPISLTACSSSPPSLKLTIAD